MSGTGGREEEESNTLKSLLGDNSPDCSGIKSFFESTWQEKCSEFRWKNRYKLLRNDQDSMSGLLGSKAEFHASNYWNDDAVKRSPYEEVISQGWNALVHLLEEASISSETKDHHHTSPLLFKDQSSVTNDLASSYNNSLFAAYLDGCSVVLNHADWTSPWIAALCEDLQRSFPHSYANVYITPPGSQAVSAHADDRDVIIIQVSGQKDWKVYSKVPVPLPYPREQVGKEGLEVPAEVLEGPSLIETTLHPGDALYMPRGYVHEARANESSFSFHVTIALATHDWSLCGILCNATDKILHNVLDYRKAINRRIGVRDLKDIPNKHQEKLQAQIEEAFNLLQKEITLESISKNMAAKFHRHNHRAFSSRMKIMHEMRFPRSATTSDDSERVVGPQAAKLVSLNSLVRAPTDAEKDSVMMDGPRGLRVREAVAGDIIQILTALQTGPNQKGVAVRDLKYLLQPDKSTPKAQLKCDLTLLSFCKVCIAQGALAVVQQQLL